MGLTTDQLSCGAEYPCEASPPRRICSTSHLIDNRNRARGCGEFATTSLVPLEGNSNHSEWRFLFRPQWEPTNVPNGQFPYLEPSAFMELGSHTNGTIKNYRPKNTNRPPTQKSVSLILFHIVSYIFLPNTYITCRDPMYPNEPPPQTTHSRAPPENPTDGACGACGQLVGEVQLVAVDEGTDARFKKGHQPKATRQVLHSTGRKFWVGVTCEGSIYPTSLKPRALGGPGQPAQMI